jgi:hypothetical protein
MVVWWWGGWLVFDFASLLVVVCGAVKPLCVFATNVISYLSCLARCRVLTTTHSFVPPSFLNNLCEFRIFNHNDLGCWALGLDLSA